MISLKTGSCWAMPARIEGLATWPRLRSGNKCTKKKFHGLDFDRQKVIGNYIVDFFVKRLALVIEIDAGSHNGKADYDAQWDKYLESLGLKVFHILLPRPTATPSKTEGELSRIGTQCRAGKSVRTRVSASRMTTPLQEKTFF